MRSHEIETRIFFSVVLAKQKPSKYIGLVSVFYCNSTFVLCFVRCAIIVIHIRMGIAYFHKPIYGALVLLIVCRQNTT